MRLTKTQEKKITEMIRQSMDNLEDVINTALNNVLEENNIVNNEDTLEFARKIFFAG